MARFMIDDPTKTDPRALLTTAKMAAISDMVTPNPQYLLVTGDNTLTVQENCLFSIGGNSVFKSLTTMIGAGNLDAGVFTVGNDYYVYICDNGGDIESYVISLNSTFPAGYTATNSRKIGGFHFGRCRRVNTTLKPINPASAVYGAGWEANTFDGIVPRSVWTLAHRPKCAPEGMVYLGNGVWVDIYLSSDDGAGGLRSILGGTPLTGTEGHNWYSFNDRALLIGKRLLSYAEFCQMAYGSPQGNDGDNLNAWSMTTNTGRNPAGNVANAVSAIGCRDAVGNVWEWLDEFVTRAEHYIFSGAGTFPSYDGSRSGKAFTNGNGHGVSGAWTWDTFTPLGDTAGGNPNNGNIYQYYDWSLVALVGGGSWSYGVQAGSRAVHLNSYPWIVSTPSGVRCACESL